MRIAIMQPTWLPWIGYFDLIDQVDQFVFLDTVQYCRRSWHSRNRIKTKDGLHWISIPVKAGNRDQTTLMDAKISPSNQIDKWRKTLAQAYAQAPARDTELPFIRDRLSALEDGASLADVNLQIIRMLMERLEITTPTVRASELSVYEGRVDRLVGICRELGATSYLSPLGSVG